MPWSAPCSTLTLFAQAPLPVRKRSLDTEEAKAQAALVGVKTVQSPEMKNNSEAQNPETRVPESLRALPLTWSSPGAAEIVHQRDMFVAAVKKVYGYSETDLFHNRATTEGRNLPGKSYRDIKQNWELKRKRMTQAMVNSHLSEMEQVLKEMKRRTDGLESPLEMGENPYTMALDPTLTCDQGSVQQFSLVPFSCISAEHLEHCE